MSELTEYRTARAFELRATEAGTPLSNTPRRISGYAVRYGTLSGNLGGFYETIAPTAFDKVLRRSDIANTCCLLNHNTSAVLGRVGAGTLRLRSDGKGLFFENDVPDTTAGRDAWESIKRGDIRGMSFGFTVNGADGEDDWSDMDDPEDRSRRIAFRTVHSVHNLLEISATPYPAYSSTDVAARTLAMVEIPQSAGQEFRSRILKNRLEWADRNGVMLRRQSLLHFVLGC